MLIKQLMITGSNQHPEVNDDWATFIVLDVTKDYTKEQLVEIVASRYPHYVNYAMWLYEGPDYEDNTTGRLLANGTVVNDMAFHPWNGPHIKLIKEANLHSEEESEDDWMQEWRREIAMQAGMMGGCEAYNEVMGY